MKTILKISIPAIITALTIFGCTPIRRPQPEPQACFLVNKDTVFVGEPVYFSNCSNNADKYFWEFGDGQTSIEEHPTYAYNTPGNYQIHLTADNYDGSFNKATKIITVLGKTELDILVMYVGTNDPVSNCKVTIYGTKADWQNYENAIASKTTKQSGNVVFGKLEPKIYYMDAYRSVSDTSYYSNELQGYATETLEEFETNKYNVYVELLYNSSKGDRNYVIRKIEPRE